MLENKLESPHVNNQKRDFWYDHIKKWESSDLRQEAYCTQAGISYPSFVYWRSHFLLASGSTKKSELVPVKIKQTPPDLSQSIKIKLTTGSVVSIPINMGISEIAKLIRLLEA